MVTSVMEGTTLSPFRVENGKTGIHAASGTPPSSPQAGDLWQETSSGIYFQRDSVRGKWLSSEMISLAFGRSGNTTSGTFYFSAGGATYTTSNGEVMPRNGTIVGFSWSRTNNLATSFRLFRNAVSLVDIATGVALTGSTLTLNLDFSANERIAVQNLGPSTVANAIGLVFVRWRA